ncbi:MAG: WD40/YVTN/BNR-like repeat-containing protein, partial [bacterium]
TKIGRFPGVPSMTYVSRVVASRHNEATVYATFDGHRSNDFKPYVLKSTDYGKTWRSIASKLPMSSVQVIREHPRMPSLLFVGNEIGAWYSGNSGRSWTRLQYNLPTVPVHDIRIHASENDLVIGTHGRGIYIIDDITPLERIAEADRIDRLYLFPVKPATVFNYNTSIPGGARGAGSLGERSFSAPNPPFGATLTYYLKDSVPKGRTLTLAIYDSASKLVRDLTVNTKSGMHRATWDLRLPPPYINPRAQGERGQPRGAFVLPGRYAARLSLAGNDTVARDSLPVTRSDRQSNPQRNPLMSTSVETPITVNADPLVPLSAAEYHTLWEMRVRSGAQQGKVQAVVRTAELLKDQMTEVKAALKSSAAPDSLTKQTEAIDKEVDDILTKVRGRQGPGASGVDDKKFAPSIQDRVNQIGGEIGDVTSPPTQIQRETLELAMKDLERDAARLNALLTTRVPALNRALDATGVPWTAGRTVR